MTQDEIDQIKSVAAQVTAAVLSAAAPEIIALMNAAREARIAAFTSLPMVPGTIEAYEPVGARDYRKQLWVQVYAEAFGNPAFVDGASACANAAVAAFDAAFPK